MEGNIGQNTNIFQCYSSLISYTLKTSADMMAKIVCVINKNYLQGYILGDI